MTFIKELRYSCYILTHPFDGFYDLKHENKGSLRTAIIIYLLTGLSALIKSQCTEYEFTGGAEPLHPMLEMILAVGPYLLWAVSNWCFSSLMDGEGSIKDILCVTGYALPPIIVSNLVYTVASWVLTSNEANYMGLISAIGLLWTILLVFFGMLTVQQYTLGKSVLTALLTIVGMAIILFLGVMLFYLIQQVYMFLINCVTELQLRGY